ncbi:hypothetical protein [Bradyrhizobium viridifuturi]|nr:hypothetical protein [Bradyrhizobium viridifuturi]
MGSPKRCGVARSGEWRRLGLITGSAAAFIDVVLAKARTHNHRMR